MANLRQLIDDFATAKIAYDALGDDCDCEGPEWDAYEAAEHAVIVYPIRDLDEVRQKARFFLDEAGPNDTLRSCYGSSGRCLDMFLRSLIGEGQP
jgi:hypothetical protein